MWQTGRFSSFDLQTQKMLCTYRRGCNNLMVKIITKRHKPHAVWWITGMTIVTRKNIHEEIIDPVPNPCKSTDSGRKDGYKSQLGEHFKCRHQWAPYLWIHLFFTNPQPNHSCWGSLRKLLWVRNLVASHWQTWARDLLDQRRIVRRASRCWHGRSCDRRS